MPQGLIRLRFTGDSENHPLKSSAPLIRFAGKRIFEDYLLSRRLYLYTKSTSQNPWTTKFIEFALSSEGQRIVGESGFVAQTIKAENTAIAAKTAPAF